MKYKEGPWFVPLLFMATLLAAVVFAPDTLHSVAARLIHGGAVTVAGTNNVDQGITPQQINLRLPTPGPPSAQVGPPTTWNN